MREEMIGKIEKFSDMSISENGDLVEEVSFIIIPYKKWELLKKDEL
jgi:hypothetical protein